MPTQADVANLNNSLDSLTRTLLQKRMMKQQDAQRTEAQRTADERTQIDRESLRMRRQGMQEDRDFRDEQMDLRRTEGLEQRVKFVAEHFTKQVAEGQASDEDIERMNQWGKDNGFPVLWRKVTPASEDANTSQAVKTARNVLTMRQRAAQLRQAGDEAAAKEYEDLANRLANNIGSASTGPEEKPYTESSSVDGVHPSHWQNPDTGKWEPHPEAGKPIRGKKTASGDPAKVAEWEKRQFGEPAGGAAVPKPESVPMFEDEDAARAMGKKAGDIVILKNINKKVRLK